jgi:hypothetical protein
MLSTCDGRARRLLTCVLCFPLPKLFVVEGISAELIGNHSLDDPRQYAEHWFDTNVWGSILDRCLRSVPDFVLNRSVL